MRVPIVRTDADGSCHRGTALLVADGQKALLTDFRDADGNPLELPPGSSYEAAIDVTDLEGQAGS